MSGFNFIDNDNIKKEHLWADGTHLNENYLYQKFK